MKKLSVLVTTLTTAVSAFAYYGDYGYSSRSESGAEVFLGVVIIIVAILNIILFFKIWGMTDNIKALKKDHFNENAFENKAETASYLRKNLVLGNMDNVKRILLQNFIDNVERAYGKLKTGDYDNKNNWVSYKEENLQKNIKPYVDNLIKLYARIGEEVPVYILRMKTFGDYFGFFVEGDLMVDIEKNDEETKE